MKLRMSELEEQLFNAFISCATSYLEFGSGGSTVLADTVVKGPVVSIESDQQWIDNVKALAKNGALYERKFICVDIGPTGAWGVPTKKHGDVDYLNYHTNVWNDIEGKFDLYFVDGRFRIACFCQCLLKSRPDSIVGIHDYRARGHYHAVEEVATPIAEAENLTFFRKKKGVRETKIKEMLEKYKLTVQ